MECEPPIAPPTKLALNVKHFNARNSSLMLNEKCSSLSRLFNLAIPFAWWKKISIKTQLALLKVETKKVFCFFFVVHLKGEEEKCLRRIQNWSRKILPESIHFNLRSCIQLKFNFFMHQISFFLWFSRTPKNRTRKEIEVALVFVFCLNG